MLKKTGFLFLLSLIVVTNTSYAQVCDKTLPASTPDSRFSNTGTGTVTDLKTALMWKHCPEGMVSKGAVDCAGAALKLDWLSALQHVQVVNGDKSLNLGYTDWRLPNIKELESIVERQCITPAINLKVFPQVVGNGYWSSTAYANGGISTWFLSFYSGSPVTNGVSFNANIRLVRDATTGLQ